ncbi:MAG: CPBP family intramembrane metalloprotease [Clostridia bacterium]|nr:CPBP family intramembrane metalloprotease [Clostridia bacterium]
MKKRFSEIMQSPAFTTPLLVIFVIVAMHFSRYALANLSEKTNVVLAIGVIQLAVLALPCMIYYLVKGRKLSSPVMFFSGRGVNALFVLFAALFFVSGMLLIKYLYFINGGTVASLVNYYGGAGTLENTGHAEIIISLIIIPAVCEELFFRGIVYSEYRRYGSANAIIVSALCFAALHFSVQNFFVYLFAGLLLGFVTAITRSCLPSIALHLLSNTLSIYASDAFLRVTVVKNGAYFIGFVLIILTAVTFALMLSRVESICYKYANDPPVEAIPPKSSENVWRVFLSPTFLLLAGVFVAVNIWLK